MGVVWPTTAIGQPVTRDCPSGQMGEMSRVCQEGGVWGDIVNQCSNQWTLRSYLVARRCPADTVEGVAFPETPANSTFTAQCPAGKSGSITRFCAVDATWQAPVNACGRHCCIG